MTVPQRLDAVCELTMGQAPDGKSYNTDGDGLPLIAGAGDFGSVHPAAKKFTTAPGKVCCPGDVVLGIRATIGEKVVADREYCLGRGVAGLRARLGLDSRYLWHWLTHAGPTLAAKAKGATFKQVNRDDIGELAISLPPLPVQRRIAEVLDRAEALRAKRRAALAQLDTLTQSIFLDMFGDPLRNGRGWPIEPMGVVAERITKGESPKWQGFEYQTDGALFVTSENVRSGEIDLSNPKFVPLEFSRKLRRSELRQGDLLINLVGASIGRSCLFPGYHGPANVNQAVGVVTLNAAHAEPVYVAGLLKSTPGQRLLLGNRVEAARANISLTDLRELPLPVPPRDQQRAFAHRVAAVEKLKATYHVARAELDALFASLQHRAFRGEL